LEKNLAVAELRMTVTLGWIEFNSYGVHVLAEGRPPKISSLLYPANLSFHLNKLGLLN
jgi:hypothetical protein